VGGTACLAEILREAGAVRVCRVAPHRQRVASRDGARA
jgi:hypothetical protein